MERIKKQTIKVKGLGAGHSGKMAIGPIEDHDEFMRKFNHPDAKVDYLPSGWVRSTLTEPTAEKPIRFDLPPIWKHPILFFKHFLNRFRYRAAYAFYRRHVIDGLVEE